MTHIPQHAAAALDTGEDLEQLVRRTRRRLRVAWLLAGLALWAVATIVTLLAMVGIDLLTPLPVWLRVAFCGVLLAVTATTFAVGLLWPQLHPPSLWAVAQRIEDVAGNMHNRLLSVLDLRRRAAPGQFGEPFFVRLLEQTRQRLAGFDRQRVVSTMRLRNALAAAVGAAVLLLMAMLFFPESAPTAAARLLMPTRDIPPATWVRFEKPQDLDVLQGEALTLTAKLTRGDLSQVTLRLREADGVWHSYPMTAVSSTEFAFPLQRVDQSQQYQFAGGGTWTEPRTIRAVGRPVIEAVDLKIKLPAYTGVAEPVPVPADAAQVSALVGSTIDVDVAVAGDPASGRIVLYNLLTTHKTKQIENERVWLDDSFPSDAKNIASVSWVSDPVLSGSHAFTPRKPGERCGFETKLEPFILHPGEQLSMYVYLPPKQAPDEAALTFLIDDQWRKVALVSAARRKAFEGQENNQFVTVAALPEPGRWTRVVVSPEQMLREEPAGPVRISGLTVESDKGKMFVDRIGSFRLETQRSLTTELREAGELSLHRDPATGRWRGQAPVQAEVHMSYEFANALGNRSRAYQPLRILPVADQPPTVVVERPDKSLTLSAAEPVAIVARGFDDFGVAQITLEAGRSARDLREQRTLETYSEPKPARVVMSAIDPAAFDLKPGEAVYYRLRITDRKGQTSVSDTQRLALAKELSTDPTAREKQTQQIDAALAGLRQAGELPANALQVPAELLDKLLGKLSDGTSGGAAGMQGVLSLTNADGTPLTAAQLQQMLDAQVAALSDDEHQQLWAAEQALSQQEQHMRDSAQRLAQALTLAQQSPATMPLSPEAIAQMQQQMADMLRHDAAIEANQQLSIDELQAMQQMAQRQAELSQLQSQLAQMQVAQQQWAADPAAAQQQMQQLMAQMQAQRAAAQMQQLGDFLQQQQQQMDLLARQQSQLHEQTKQAATGGELHQASDAQQQLDPEMLEAMTDAQRMLQTLRDRRREQQRLADLAPWTPPGERVDRGPVERDTPEDAEDTRTPEQVKAALKQQMAQLQEDEQWWQTPVPAPPRTRTEQIDERFEGRQRDVEPVAAQTPELSPKQMLEQHQEQMHQALTQNSDDLREQLQQVSAITEQLKRLHEQIAAPQTPGVPPEASRSQATPPDAASGGAGASQLSPGQRQAMQELSALMQSSAMMQAQSMAQRAAAMLVMSSGASGGASGGGGDFSVGVSSPFARPGVLIEVELPDITAEQQAKLYRLPPSVRQPLLQGMQQRGPEGYQELIDAYYRELTQEQP